METTTIINISIEAFSFVISLILFCCLYFGEDKRTKLGRIFIWMLVLNMITLAFFIMSVAFEGGKQSFARQAVLWGNNFYHVFWLILRIMLSKYLFTYVSGKTKSFCWFMPYVYVVISVNIMLLVMSHFNGIMYHVDENNFFCHGALYFVFPMSGYIIYIVELFIVFKTRKLFGKADTISLISYELIPTVMSEIGGWIGVFMLDSSMTIALFILYTRIQLEQGKKLKKQEMELQNARVEAMISQIQPHFLYNSLTAIADACEDAPKAKDAIIDFSHYLRGNLTSLKSKKLISFNEELDHIEAYLRLEQLRFGEMLNIVYDIGPKDFFIPALTVQPIIENAVKHGVGRKVDGGMVTLLTQETDTEYMIIVLDNGVGFNVEMGYNDERIHIGIENVKYRLQMQCQGSLNIVSKVDFGTTVTIHIPK